MKNIGESEFFMNNLVDEIITRKALDSDADIILELLDTYSDQGLLLSLSLQDILSRINTFAVSESDGKVIGCASLKDFENNLFEVRSLAVNSQYTGRQIGSKLVNFLLEESQIPEGSRIFALTYRASFFQRLGFELVSKDQFPEKIWHDCEKCQKKDHCDEQAVLKKM